MSGPTFTVDLRCRPMFPPSKVDHDLIPPEEAAMPETPNNNEKGIVRIELTSEQKEQVKEITKKSAEAIELTVEELEQRIAPLMMY